MVKWERGSAGVARRAYSEGYNTTDEPGMHSRIVQHLTKRRRFFSCSYSASITIASKGRECFFLQHGKDWRIAFSFLKLFYFTASRNPFSGLVSLGKKHIINTRISQYKHHEHRQAVIMHRRSSPLFKVLDLPVPPGLSCIPKTAAIAAHSNPIPH
jgi:hypothetical protein